jgi:hypothetical protein
MNDVKDVLLIGTSNSIYEFMAQIIMSFKGNCLHADSMFNGIEKLYAKKIDVMVISSIILKNDGGRFLDFVKEHFLIDKIIISLDNGTSSLQHIPEDIQVVNTEAVLDCGALI